MPLIIIFFSQVIIFLCSGLCVYWTMRAWTIASADEDEIDQVLETDWWVMKDVLLILRSFLVPPTQI
jgi:hypothetical protein